MFLLLFSYRLYAQYQYIQFLWTCQSNPNKKEAALRGPRHHTLISVFAILAVSGIVLTLILIVVLTVFGTVLTFVLVVILHFVLVVVHIIIISRHVKYLLSCLRQIAAFLTTTLVWLQTQKTIHQIYVLIFYSTDKMPAPKTNLLQPMQPDCQNKPGQIPT